VGGGGDGGFPVALGKGTVPQAIGKGGGGKLRYIGNGQEMSQGTRKEITNGVM